MKSFHILRVSIIVIVQFYCFCSKTGDTTLATFKGGSVLINEYVEYFFSSTRYQKDVVPDEENLKHIVTLKALEKIAVLEALEQDIDQDSVYIESYENNLRKTLFYRYMRQEIINKVITDSLIEKFYRNYTPQYHMSYIMRPVPRSSPASLEETQKDTIEFVYKLLENGRDFEDLAKKYSQDITTNPKGGSLGFVIRESMGDAALRATMDTLADFSWSAPIRGFEGYYILYKGEKREVPVPPLDEIRDKIWQTLYRTRRHDIEKVLDVRFEDLSTKYNYTPNETLIENVLIKAGADSASTLASDLDFERLSEKDMGEALATYDDGYIKVYELFEEKNRVPGNKLEFKERLETLSQRHLLSKHAIELGYQDLQDIKEKMEDVRESLLRSFLHRRNVIDVAKVRLETIEETKVQGDSSEPDQFRRVRMERRLREEFEEKLKRKYNFRFVGKNFAAALEVAKGEKLGEN